MSGQAKTLRDLIAFTRDGEWGKAEPFSSSLQMRVIRGTDFEDAAYGELEATPVRYIAKRHGTRKQLEPQDIVIETAGGSKNRPTGRTLFVKDRLIAESNLPLICASFARFIRIDPTEAVPEYVYWHLQWLYQSVLAHSSVGPGWVDFV